jgi:hypothetical protein
LNHLSFNKITLVLLEQSAQLLKTVYSKTCMESKHFRSSSLSTSRYFSSMTLAGTAHLAMLSVGCNLSCAVVWTTPRSQAVGENSQQLSLRQQQAWQQQAWPQQAWQQQAWQQQQQQQQQEPDHDGLTLLLNEDSRLNLLHCQWTSGDSWGPRPGQPQLMGSVQHAGVN